MLEGPLGKTLQTSRTEIIAIGGGKGGTGKSFLASNLGIALAQKGKRVVLIDADLGCANLHSCLGVEYPEFTLSDLLKGRIKHLREAIVPTGISNLGLVSGAQDILEMANPKYSQKMRILRHIQELDVDYLVMDLGAGTGFNILDFFLIADQGILTVLPEPTSIENAYRFIKSVFFRRFRKLAKEKPVKEIISLAMDQKNTRGIRTPHDLIQEVRRIDPEIGNRLQESMKTLRPKLVVNQVRCKDDITLGFSMRSSCSKYFGIQIEYLGYIEFDDHVWHAAKRRRPVILEYPSCGSGRGIREISINLENNKQFSMEYLTDSVLRT